MSSRESTIDERLVPDVDRVAFAALPLLIGADDARRGRYAIQLADVLGNVGEFQQYISGSAPERLARLRLMGVVSDFREAMWAVLQQGLSSLEVDFVAYAEAHFARLLRAAAEPSFTADLAVVEHGRRGG